MTHLDTSRHESVFQWSKFGNMRVDVIGAGATGFHLLPELGKLKIKNLHVWDPDIIEPHNIPNHGLVDLDSQRDSILKVEALRQLVKRTSGSDIIIHPERVTGKTTGLGEVVFLLVDRMKTRKEIFEGAIRYKSVTRLMIETRIGADLGRIYTINPNSDADVDYWQSQWYDDPPESEMAACGATVTVGATAMAVAAYGVWQLINWFAREQGEERPLDREIILSMRAPSLLL